MPTAKKPVKEVHIEVHEVVRKIMRVLLLGVTPIILNRLSEKVKRELLLPAIKKTKSQRESTLKHNPMEEFRSAPYVLDREGDSAPTYLAHLSSAFKGAICTAAYDMGGTKAQTGRLVNVIGNRIPIYGVPELLMSVVRSAGMNRTPDIRSRLIIPNWACEIEVSFVEPMMREQPVANLIAGAGMLVGVGDWRPEKGKGGYGQFEMVGADDPRYKAVVKAGGRKAQIEAMENPGYHDDDTRDLFEWWQAEAARRGFEVAA